MAPRIVSILLGITLVCSLSPVRYSVGASESGQFAVKGVGHDQCSDYLKARSSGTSRYERYGHYIAGYLTATNRLLTDTVDITSWESIDVVAAYVANVCKFKPDVRIAQAIEAVLARLRPHRIAKDTELVDVSSGGPSIRVYASVIIRAKRALIEQELYEGPIDASFGESTANALREFQERNRIPATGLPDQRTLYLLFRRKEAVSTE